MSVSISVHVDGYYGLVRGVRNLLNLFEKYQIKASFFVNMGNEANLFELIKYRSRGLKGKDKSVVKRYSRIGLIKMILLSRKLGNGNKKILREIIKGGHELNPHSWSHLIWSKNFDKMNYKKQIFLMKDSFFKCTGKYPKGFAPPTWKINDKILKELKNQGFEYVSIDRGENEVREEIKIIPLSFPNSIEELLNEGNTREEIIKIYKRELNKKEVNLYFHADFEGIRGIKLFEEVIKMIDPKKVKLIYENLV